jgi:large subunit ribosomal protein L3
MKTFYGTKLTSTALFDDKGRRQVVTRIKAEPLTVKYVKTDAKDGYFALVCSFGKKNLKEIKLQEAATQKPGDQIKAADLFKEGDLVKVTGTSKGRGFAGVVKRHGFHGVGGRTHGQSDRQRHPGSIGMRTTPGRLWKGKRMAGHYGVETVSVINLKVVSVEDSSLTVSGTIPGAKNSLVVINKL